MKFRAVAETKREKPLQIFGDNLAVIERWANDVAQDEQATVKVYESKEHLISTWSPRPQCPAGENPVQAVQTKSATAR